MGASGEDDDNEEARRFTVDALRVIAELADSPSSTPIGREKAHRALESQLLRLKGLTENPDLSADFRYNIEVILRKFRHS
jgi:hypothetical protein